MAAITTSAPAAALNPIEQGMKEAFYAGVIAFGLFVLFIGLKTDQNISNELILVQRWGLLAIIVIIVMAVRFLYVAFALPALASRKAAKAAAPVVAAEPGFLGRNLSQISIVLLFLFPVVAIWLSGLQGSLKWIDNFGIQILIYVMLAWGLNIVVGLAGLLDLGYVAFYAVGAYAYALIGTYLYAVLPPEYAWMAFWILLPSAGIMAAFWGVILGFPVLRLRGDYLAIVTLAFGEIIRLVLINWREVTNGSAGISGIPKVEFFGWFTFNVSDPNYIAKVFELPTSSVYYKIFLYYLILLLCLLTAYVTIRLRRMPVGRAWEAMREDEIACRSLGINTTTTKLTAFATGAMFAGFAGSFFAARQGFVSPESFVFIESAIILAIVVLGGMGSLIGIAFAALAMIGGTEILRELQFLKQVFGPDFTPELYRMLLFGMAMVIVMLWKPRGFVGSREPTAFLRERRAVSASFTKEGHG
ncbi:high-affinity branched-chain amino acid ABC transporter permease LivM [Mesorhizobium sp. LHD-90]|uniref:high-affinity branched-chain amino acid ABC transporter permease LivM n=1 Tax=Mesorhizobium sp. LHD-90 TaxID=3071414 RepID=UPI0027DFF3A7|nr:high-affinity branched-chain amino acid ABC transporter permease LivM [Mesorhizobium sp. LHD-90]MDQ6437103.1 high-affinity branched-chain amino acid ABC transporter permease LivM [Mesorhizobium sp. LHD-90]